MSTDTIDTKALRERMKRAIRWGTTSLTVTSDELMPILDAADRLAALEEENGRLKEALAPFIQEALQWKDATGDDEMPVAMGHWNDVSCTFCESQDTIQCLEDTQFTLGDLRRLIDLSEEALAATEVGSE